MRTSLNIGGSDVPPLPDGNAKHLPNAAAEAAQGRPQRWRGAMLAMMAVDATTAVIALVLAAAILGQFAPDTARMPIAIIPPLALVLIGAQAALGRYGVPGPGPCAVLRIRCLAIGLMTSTCLVVTLPAYGLGAALVLGLLSGGLLLLMGHYGGSVAGKALGPAGLWGTSIAMIGTGQAARTVATALITHPGIGLRPVGFIALPDQPAVGFELPLPLLCRLEHAAAVAPMIDLGVLARPLRERSEIEAELGPLPIARIAFIKDASDVEARRLQPIWRQEPSGSSLGNNRQGPDARAIKRSIDLLIAVPAAFVALPLVVLLAAAVRLADPGKALYTQQRIGFRGKPFGVFKIRSMYQDAEQRLEACLAEDPARAAEWRSNFKLANDPRVLPGIGMLLRRFSLDELPQLWNVIRGDMSLVGPRPFPGYHMRSFDPEFQALRVSVPPGLTGLWQISARSDGDLGVQKEQDMLYIEHGSIWLDLQILLDTVPAVLGGKGAR